VKLVALVVASAAALAAVSGLGSEAARAHESDCHLERTCPADDASYLWYDAEEQGWYCTAQDPAVPPPADATAIVYEDLPYSCRVGEPLGPLRPPVEQQLEAQAAFSTIESELPLAPETGTAPPGLPGRSSLRPIRRGLPTLRRQPPSLSTPPLTAGGYVFPVYGPAAFVDTFGAPRSTVTWHHGQDIFATLGAPVLAVADGTVFSVGWNDLGGNRLWLRDRAGNEFYYAHLSAFSTLAVEGAHVHAGAVLGFIGATGDAQGTPPHLHFEIHPVGLLALGYDGVVNPYPYLQAWQRLEDIPFGTAGLVFGAGSGPGSAPRAGAILLSSSDISVANGLEPGALRRALEAPLEVNETALERAARASGIERAVSARERAETVTALQAQAVDFAARSSFGPLDASVWDAIAHCESRGNWAADTGNGYAGGLQFAPGTWLSYGGGAYAASPARATREQQIAIARLVLSGQGWAAWPACSTRLGLR
jgi:hypothetical protein